MYSIPDDSIKEEAINVAVLDGVKVTTLSNHEILLSDLWKTQRVVLVIFRRCVCVL